MKIFKFGGASVKDAESVKNVAAILDNHASDKVLVVISAMAKTTNLLENVVDAFVYKKSEMTAKMNEFADFHIKLCKELITDDNHPIFNDLENIFLELECLTEKEVKDDYDFVYDQIVSYGEIISTKIVSAYLLAQGIKNKWVDARNFIFTNSNFREAGVNWSETEHIISTKLKPFAEKSMVITQGFIGKDRNNATTTLGREGSDYSAAIFAWCLNASSVTIWKDVAGVMNADPRKVNSAEKIDSLSFDQAIELAYYGASVIHPKTIQPLKSKGIPLYVKSFVNPNETGTVVKEGKEFKTDKICFIFKENQCLLSLKTRDFSFVAENNLQEIFRILSVHKVRVNVMQNSAISFKTIVDCDERKLSKIIHDLEQSFEIKHTPNLRLISIYNHVGKIIPEFLTQEKKVLLEQKTERVLHLVLA
ncbi:MAG: aspartate kinase [Bacteroidia bacterium]|nr:aspartate kinase [Bacteroidia bacterium]MCO5253930.1 aspartate kinase [Bacteroidota bacterium]MCZ2128879.1 aspartate kinase [Bacteroidia bacterium]